MCEDKECTKCGGVGSYFVGETITCDHCEGTGVEPASCFCHIVGILLVAIFLAILAYLYFKMTAIPE